MTYSATEKAKCARREAAFRKTVYRYKVQRETMTQADADREIAIMEEIAGDYEREAGQTGFFDAERG